MVQRQDPDVHLNALAKVILEGPDGSQQQLLEHGFALASGLLYDVKRIADALEAIAAKMPSPPLPNIGPAHS